MSTLQDKLNAPFVDLLPRPEKKLSREEFLALNDSELLELAVRDLRRLGSFQTVDGRPYQFDVMHYHGRDLKDFGATERNGGTATACLACVAGSVAVGSFDVRSREAYEALGIEVRSRLGQVSDYALGCVDDISDISERHCKAASMDTHEGMTATQMTAYLTEVIAYLKSQGR
jgi:hypothetical protein